MSRLARLPTFLYPCFSSSNSTSVSFYTAASGGTQYHYLIKSSYFPRSTSRQIVTGKSYLLVLSWKNKGSKVTSFQSYKLYSLIIYLILYLISYGIASDGRILTQPVNNMFMVYVDLSGPWFSKNFKSLCLFSVNIRRTFLVIHEI